MTPNTEEAETPPSTVTPGRQRPRAACDECRRRKLRCDGQQPQCGVCQASGTVCEVTPRGIRGPKKGYVKALRSRVMHLEAMLVNRSGAHLGQQQERDSTGSSSDNVLPTAPVDNSEATAAEYGLSWLPATTASVMEPEMLQDPLPDLDTLSEWPLASKLPLISDAHMHITDSVHAELDQLYWDRVHPSIPMLHQRRYLSWSKYKTKTSPRTCLQWAMWTLASLLSTQFRDMTQPLYHEAKQLLESLSIEDNQRSGYETELIQAWVLIATCESMRTHHRQAWMSAGRAFRLVQAMRFHDIDSPRNHKGPSSLDTGDFIQTEEKRRVFWVAYFLDHVFSIRNDWPITLNEHMICTRLPAADMEFHNGQHMVGDFLSEAMTEPSPKVRSPFNECLILVTICGRSLLRGQQQKISKAYGDLAMDWLEQRRWLDNILTSRLQVLSECYPPPTEAYDPLLLFANILSQATVVYYCKGMMESVESPVDPLETSVEVLEWQFRALAASAAIIRLAKGLCELHVSKIHPLMPIPLFLTAEFLYDNLSGNESFRLHLQQLAEILYRLKNVNDHDQSYIDLLPASCIPKSADFLTYSTQASDASQ